MIFEEHKIKAYKDLIPVYQNVQHPPNPGPLCPCILYTPMELSTILTIYIIIIHIVMFSIMAFLEVLS